MKLSTMALAGTLALACAGAAVAQPAPPPGRSAEAMRIHRPDPAQLAERRAERLRTVLQLRPDQDAALRAFVDAQGRPEGFRDRRRGERSTGAAATTPQRLEQARTRMAERQAAFDRRAQATLRFYAQLSPTQQKAFDALRPGDGHMKRGGGRRGGMGHGRG